MNTFLVKLDKFEDIKKKSFYSCIPLMENSEILFFVQDNNKIYGVYKVDKINFFKFKEVWKIFYSPRIKYRRGASVELLKQFNIRVVLKGDIYKIQRKKFNKICEVLREVNFPQLASDLLWIEFNEHRCIIKYFQSYPELKIYCDHIDIHRDLLLEYARQCETEIKTVKEKYGYKLFSFFNKSQIFSIIKPGRDLCIIFTEYGHLIPVEVMFDGKKFLITKYNIARMLLTPTEPEKMLDMFEFINNVAVIAPIYKDSSFSFEKIYKLFASKIKRVIVFNKKLGKREFARICETTKVLYFAGHTVFNKQKKDFALKLSDNVFFYLKDFQQCVRLPELIIFHTCFENRYFKFAEENLKYFFTAGTKNVLIPFMEIPAESERIILYFVKYILTGNKIGEAFRLSVINSIENNKDDWIYFRLYGDPKSKIF